MGDWRVGHSPARPMPSGGAASLPRTVYCPSCTQRKTEDHMKPAVKGKPRKCIACGNKAGGFLIGRRG